MQVEVKGALALVVGGGMQANLGRIFTYCSNNADGCRSEISAYVKGVAQLHNGRPPPPSRDAVRIIVRTSAYLRASSPQTADPMQWRPLVGDLVMLPAIDAPQAIFPFSEKNYGDLGLSADEVFNLGLANLQTRLKPLMQVTEVAQPGQLLYIEGDVYHSSRLVLHESWSRLATPQGGKLIVAAPETDTYVAEDTPAAIKALRTLTQNIMSRSPRPLSNELLRWTARRWEVVRQARATRLGDASDGTIVADPRTSEKLDPAPRNAAMWLKSVCAGRSAMAVSTATLPLWRTSDICARYS